MLVCSQFMILGPVVIIFYPHTGKTTTCSWVGSLKNNIGFEMPETVLLSYSDRVWVFFPSRYQMLIDLRPNKKDYK